MRKLRSKGGFSLPEVLMAVALLGILAAGCAVASGSILGIHKGMIEAGDAQVVGGTVMEAIAGEVRYGQDVKTESDGTITFDSKTFGPSTSFGLSGDGRVQVTSAVSLAPTAAKKTVELLPKRAYSGLTLTKLSVAVDVDDADMVDIAVTVKGLNGELWSGSMKVAPLNEIK